MVFKFRQGYSAKVSANVVGARLEEIREEHGGIITPKDVVRDAKPVESPLHPCFEWDNRKAADLHRESQARMIIRCVEIVKDDDAGLPEPRAQMAYVSVAGSKGSAGYMATTEAMGDPEMAYGIIRDAKAQLRAWRRRFGHLEELSPVVEAIDELEGAMV